MERTLQQLVSTVKLPTLPGVACRILELCEDPDACARDYARVIESDPALAARLLKFANSAFFGLGRKVSTVERAAVTLGVDHVRAVALGFSVAKSIGKARSQQFNTQLFWRDSLFHGCIARAVADRVGFPKREESFLVGLLQDIGVPFMANYYGPRYAELLERTAGRHIELFSAESATLDLTHPAVGGHVCHEWKLPDMLTRAIVRHHLAAPGPLGKDEGGILWRIAYLAGAVPLTDGPDDDGVAGPAITFAQGTFGMSPGELIQLLQDSRAEFSRVATVFSELLPADADLDRLVARAEALISRLGLRLPPDREEAPGAKVLIVDDDPVSLALMKGFLLKQDHVPILARSGAEALELARDERPDLILLDVIMPEMDGYQICRILKADPVTADIPIIFCTAADQTDDVVRGLELGADDYVTKPVNEQELHARLGVAMRARQRQERLDERSGLDALTGLLNRRRLEEQLAAELARPSLEPLTCAMVDLDQFKKINDSRGHAAGDVVLAKIAKLLRDSCRGSDWVSRYGGEEFVLAMPSTSLRKAAGCGERLRCSIAGTSFDHDGQILNVTASVGVAAAVEGEGVSRLLEKADQALYAAKKAGRNCVCVFLEGRGPVPVGHLDQRVGLPAAATQ